MIEDIKVGDLVVSPNNTTEVVLNVWPQGVVDIYKITFQDGRTVNTCGNHLWQYHPAGRGGERVGTTLDLKKRVDEQNAKAVGERKYLPIIPMVVPIGSQERSVLPIAPYTLGVILGDGHITPDGAPSITNLDSEIIERVRSYGVSVSVGTAKHGTDAKTYSLAGQRLNIRELKLEGTKSATKFIPEIYKNANVDDKWDIVQGLMDTDGYVTKDGKTYYDTVSPFLSKDIKDILYSLGFSVTINTKIGSYTKAGIKHECQLVYRLYIRGANQKKLFSLPRKVARCVDKVVGLRIDSIEYIGKDYATCIAISGSDKLFVTTNYIVTHNSAVCLLKNLDGINDPHFRCTIFRRTAPELKRQGGLIDESRSIYQDLGGDYKSQAMIWRFKSGASIAFSAIASDDDLGSWQGSQLVRALIDEAATKWTEKQVLFLLSRLRSAHSKIYPQLIMTCNPDIDSFLKKWVDFSLGEDGVPLPGTEHRIRWFATLENQVFWADTPEECFELYGKPRGMIYARGMSEAEIRCLPPDKLFMPKSFRFIPTGVMDNPYLLPPKNTSYLANLLSQPYVNQLKYLHGSWTAKEAGSGYFNRNWVQYVDIPPVEISGRVRAYDLAASEEPSSGNMSGRDPDYTAGVLMSRGKDGCLYIENMRRYRKLTDSVLKDIVDTAAHDGMHIPVLIPKDPGGGGAAANMFFVRYLSEAGVSVRSVKMTGHGSKVQRAIPFFAMAEAGLVKIVRDSYNDPWVENMLLELEYFTGGRNEKNDQVDAIADAASYLMKQNTIPTFSVPSFSGTSPIPKI